MVAEPLREYLIFSKDRKDIKSLNQEVVGGAFGLFQCNRIRLRAMREAKATTSEFFLVRLVEVRGTPKMDISGQGSNLILRELFNDLKKHDQKLTNLGQEKKHMNMVCWR